MTAKKIDDPKAPKAENLTDAEMTDVSGGFFHSEKGFGVKGQTKAPKAEALTDTDLDKVSGGIWNEATDEVMSGKGEAGYANLEVNYVKPKGGSTGTK